jgi:hypothetical protein
MTIETISLIVTVIVALLGYLITYWNNLLIARRKEQLELVDRRISELYGPLYVATQAGWKAYKALLLKLNKREVFDKDSPATEKELEEWRIWLKEVFMPNNELMERLIIEKAYLIQEEKMPECMLDLITHVSGYKALLAKWEKGDFSENLSVLGFPQELREYAAQSYQQLKAKQLRLIGDSKANGNTEYLR